MNIDKYWNKRGKYETTSSELDKLIPIMGSVDEPRKNPKLEKYRKARNCYYDLYNNGLGNRAREFAGVFKIAARQYEYGRHGYGQFSDRLYEETELALDKIIEDAATEQGIFITVDTHSPIENHSH